MELRECIFYDSNCYAYGKNNWTITYGKNPSRTSKSRIEGTPKGILFHSTGVNQKKLKRFVQPSKSDPKYNEIIADLGKNTLGNHWNKSSSSKGVHAMIGCNDKGEIRTYQLLPYNFCCWGVGAGAKGSYNYNPTAYIQFEILEDNLKDETYFNAVFKEAIEYTAYLCKKFGLTEKDVTSHKEAADAGYGSRHKDPTHWLAKFGKDMNWVRAKVKELLDMDSKKFNKGDIINMDGIYHYTNSSSGTIKKCIGGKAYIKDIVNLNRAHPYNVKATDDNTLGTVDGWVNASDVQVYEEPTGPIYHKGDKIIINKDEWQGYSNFDKNAYGFFIGNSGTALKSEIIDVAPATYPHPYAVRINDSGTAWLSNEQFVLDTTPSEDDENWEQMYQDLMTDYNLLKMQYRTAIMLNMKYQQDIQLLNSQIDMLKQQLGSAPETIAALEAEVSKLTKAISDIEVIISNIK